MFMIFIMNNNNKKTQFAIASNTTDCICTAKIMGSQWHWKPCTFKSKIRCILEQSRRNHLGVYALIWIRLLTEWLSISNHENNCCLMILQASPPLVKTAWFWPNCSFCPYCNKCTVTSLACRCTVHCNLCQWVCVHACICPRRGDGSPAVIVPQSHSASIPVSFTLCCAEFCFPLELLSGWLSMSGCHRSFWSTDTLPATSYSWSQRY